MHHSPEHIPVIIQSLAPIVNKYGYLAVGGLILLEDFGMPTPGETVLIAAAFFAGLGHLNIVLIIIVAIIGAVIGDNIGFAIGQYGGRSLIDRYGKYVFLTPQRVDKAEAFFNRHGGKIIIAARFFEGLRQANGIIAGLAEIKWHKFIIFNIIGAVLWVSLWASIGYFGGRHIGIFLRYQLYFSIAIIIALLILIGYKIFKFLRDRKHIQN